VGEPSPATGAQDMGVVAPAAAGAPPPVATSAATPGQPGDANTMTWAANPAAVASATTAPARRSGIPLWLMLLSVVVAAALAGVAVFFVTSGDDDSGGSVDAAGIVDGLMRLGRADQANISSYDGELPPEFAADFPMYEDAEVVVSIAIASEEGTGYLIVLSSPDPADEVYAFYNDALDVDPWQVEVGRASDEFTGLRFLRPDNIDVSGDVSLHQSQLDDRTVIYLSYSDISQALVPGGASDPFAVGGTRPLPVGFPEDIPIYEGAEPTVILDTYFERGQGGRAFIVTFLTKDSQDAVIEYYRQEFEGRGWVVSDAAQSGTSFALGIEFDDGPDQSVSGSITADAFENDPAYTQVDLLVTTSNN
jgi:hypothetical protein